MDNNFQQYHRGNYGPNGIERARGGLIAEECEEKPVPSLVMKESELIYISEPEKLLEEYMKIRGWKFKVEVSHDGSRFKASIDIDSEDVFIQTSNNQKKALIKVIISVIYHYNSMFMCIWIARHQSLLKDYIR